MERQESQVEHIRIGNDQVGQVLFYAAAATRRGIPIVHSSFQLQFAWQFLIE